MGTAYLEQSLQQNDFQRILLIKPSSLGDIIHALPVLHGLRTRFPNATIDWLVAKSFAPVLEGNPGINNLLLFDRKRFSKVGRSFRVMREFIHYVRDLRARRYELVIDLQGLFRSGFLARASGAAVRIGFSDAREWAPMFYSHKIRAQQCDMHAVDRNFLVAEPLGFAEEPIRFPMGVSDGDRAAILELLQEQSLQGGQAFIAILPGARWDTKIWPAERYAALIDSLSENDMAPCVLLGAPDEVDRCTEVASLCRMKPINIAGRTSIPQLSAAIDLAGVVVCHDSAPLHIAAALGKPLVCIVGPTNPTRTGPYGRPDDVVQLNLDCAPCYLRRVSQCPHDHRCMTELPVESVIAAVRKAMEGSAKQAVILKEES